MIILICFDTIMDEQNILICPKDKRNGSESADFVDRLENEETECEGQLCRLCANIIKSGIYIFNDVGKEEHLANKINTCLPVTVRVTDCLPKQLCMSCRNKLDICYDFAETCLSAEKKLKKIIQISSINLPIDGTLNTFCNYVDSSDDTPNNYMKFYCCPLCFEGRMIPQEDVHNSKEVDLGGMQFGTNGETVEVFVNNKEVDFDHMVFNDTSNIQEFTNNTKYLQNEDSVDSISTVTSVCCFCSQFCPDLNSSLTHSDYHFNENGFPCILCGEYFNDIVEVENHYKVHKSEMLNKIGNIQIVSSKENKYLSKLAKLCKCVECGKVFGTVERLSFHNRFHNGARPFVCERCAKEFTSENLLFRHMNLIHGGTEICKKCGATFMSIAKLDAHICALLSQPFQCKICRQQFRDTTLLRKHTSTHNFILAKPFQCNQCDISFTRISKLSEHVRTSHSILVNRQSCMTCSLCKAVFPTMELALLHLNKHSSPNLMVDVKYIEETEVSKLFCCEYCEAIFSEIDQLLKHCSEHNGLNPYHCTICNVFFSEHSQMKFHKKYHLEHENHWDNLSLFSVPIIFVCEICSKNFNTWKGLQIHYNIMHNSIFKGNVQNDAQKNCKEGELSNLCEDCGESFNKRVELRRHRLKMHRPQNKFPCEECGKVLLHYSGLVIHRRQHTGERPFVCDVCGKSFPQGPAMYTHRRTHTRDYPYRCEICGQSFNNKGDLNNHRRSKHTKERPFKCNVCNKSFLTSGVYYQHKQLHAGIRKYKCTYCERAFSRWNALSIHIKSHTGEKPHPCHVCGRGFAQKGDMKKHMKTQHGVLK